MIRRRISLTTQVLVALAAGLTAGALIAASGSESLATVPGYLEPIGTIWVNALRMVVVPLVMSAVVVGVNSLDSSSLGRVGRRALVVCLLILVAAATFAVVLGPLALSALNISPEMAAAMR